MNDIFGRFASVLERRFLLVSFLPSLIFFGGFLLLTSVVTGNLAETLSGWGRLASSVQVSAILGMFAVLWLIAGFLDSQLRNIVQLFEGYRLLRYWRKMADRGVSWHEQKRDALKRKSQVAVLELPHELRDVPESEVRSVLPEATVIDNRDPAGFSEEAWVLYSDREVLPTRLGNIIRAGEDYALSRYGADYLKVWPRLAHVCSGRFVQDYESAQAGMEFLLVISMYSGVFGFAGGIVELASKVQPMTFFLTTVICFAVCVISYNTAVEAAKDYAEQMRSSMDLFRLDLLKQLQYPSPKSQAEESAMWRELDRLIGYGTQRLTPYQAPTESNDLADASES